MLLVIFYVKFPKVELKEDEKVGTVQNYKELLRQKQVSISWGLSLSAGRSGKFTHRNANAAPHKSFE
ncbi:hypothetical protein [uncultured Parabacteroides sp.]|uniref:hypothetical protein n=1 Tax=uncultured Parabacteroides sp. TaxID=512312 RepID=UPI002628F936|nr:hypothetical protein [uncultured Parabacteroides sp.]